jgi:sulfatase maturation enzyme AslB (radical SAM superfamily)
MSPTASNTFPAERDSKLRYHIIERLGKRFIFDDYFTRVAPIPRGVATKTILSNLVKAPDEWDRLLPQSSKPVFRQACSSLPTPVFRSLSLCISNSCNLNCNYCWTKERFSKPRECGLMSEGMAKDAVDYFINELCATDEAFISFTGGETLLNWKTIQAVAIHAKKIAQRKKIKITFSINTNGTLFTSSIVKFLIKYKFEGIVTIDSDTQKVHDRLRPYVGGRGSFHTIIEAIKKHPSLVKIFVPRFTMTRHNTNILKYAQYFHSLGFSSVDFNIVLSRNKNIVIESKLLKKIDQEFEKLLHWNIEQMKRSGRILDLGFAGRIASLRRGITVECCFGGYNQICITHDGNIYPCIWYAHNPKYRIGTLSTGIDHDRQLRVLTSLQRPWTRGVRYTWSGYNIEGCPYFNDYFYKNDPNGKKIYLSIMQSQLENAIVLYYEIQKRFGF